MLKQTKRFHKRLFQKHSLKKRDWSRQLLDALKILGHLAKEICLCERNGQKRVTQLNVQYENSKSAGDEALTKKSKKPFGIIWIKNILAQLGDLKQ